MGHPLDSHGVCEQLRSQLICGMCKQLLRIPVGCDACKHAWCSVCLANAVGAREDGKIQGRRLPTAELFVCPAEGCKAQVRLKDFEVLPHLQALTNALAGDGGRLRGGSGSGSGATGASGTDLFGRPVSGASGGSTSSGSGGGGGSSGSSSSSSGGGRGTHLTLGRTFKRLKFTFPDGIAAAKTKAKDYYTKTPQLKGVMPCMGGSAKEKLKRDMGRLNRFSRVYNATFRPGAEGQTTLKRFVMDFNKEEQAKERERERKRVKAGATRGALGLVVTGNSERDKEQRTLQKQMRKDLNAMRKQSKKNAITKSYHQKGSLRPSGFSTRVSHGLRVTVPHKFRVIYSEKAKKPCVVFVASCRNLASSNPISSHLASQTGSTSTRKPASEPLPCPQRSARCSKKSSRRRKESSATVRVAVAGSLAGSWCFLPCLSTHPRQPADIKDLRARARDDDSEPLVYILKPPEKGVSGKRKRREAEADKGEGKGKGKRCKMDDHVAPLEASARPLSLPSTIVDDEEEEEKEEEEEDVMIIDDEEGGKEAAQEWKCSACTFLNRATEGACTVCQTQRPKQRP